MDSKTEFELAMVNQPSVFELLRFDCILALAKPYPLQQDTCTLNQYVIILCVD